MTDTDDDDWWRDPEEYVTYSACPECDIYAVYEPGDGGYHCHACKTFFLDEDEAKIDHYPDRTVDDVPEDAIIYEGGIDGAIQGTSLDSILQGIGGIFAPDTGDDDSRELTPGEKSRFYLSRLCIVVGILFCLTITGIPIGIGLFVLSVVASPTIEDED